MLSHKKGKEQNGRKEQHKFGELDVSSMRKYHSFIRSLVHSFIPFIHTCQLNHQLIEFIQITNDEGPSMQTLPTDCKSIGSDLNLLGCHKAWLDQGRDYKERE
ncbi:hypothetical protein RB195_017877 [Necator americanus]|uniref:Uncharacterized protein n=1 Tax=Necator americanus TaxID=51031 RepID=A0ABR1C760_NECAM